MIPITVLQDGEERLISAEPNTNLRWLLLEHGISPYTNITASLNCAGRGLCATCGVDILDGAPEAEHWHDKAAQRFGYPRLSCQVTITQPLRVRIMTEKWIWGRRVQK
jgi:ferredoxin